jgi:hypothetical protein
MPAVDALIGTKVPDVTLDHEFGKPGDVSLRDRLADKKVPSMLDTSLL